MPTLAEALAEGRGKAKAASLRRTKTELMARRVLPSGEIEQVPATALRKEDVVRVDKGELIPADGEVIEGIGSGLADRHIRHYRLCILPA